ncbi:MAG: elongation factor P maturation arginine rhamnosyltransferase EarP [Burkholderia sp.]|nr:elongation factor P maturation arginine rhamnosyltransferase EarP [Burkholderia sp.]
MQKYYDRLIRCDIFCFVIDNFGDIGVCLRLALQLAHEYDWQVQLFVNDLRTFARLLPDIRIDATHQMVNGIVIKHWDIQINNFIDVADVVIEAFACELPETYIAMMARRAKKPVWINLEYLSAEDWVANFHLRQSPHPRYALIKTFFFPGLSSGSGGVIKERDLDARFTAFKDDIDAQNVWWRTLTMSLPSPPLNSTVISLFVYENPAINALLTQWRDGSEQIVLLVSEGYISRIIACFFGIDTFGARSYVKAGNIVVYGLEFFPQAEYDKILWVSDLNFVRGEDSFVRAQWAARPFIWNIYPQTYDAHLPKLNAALLHVSSGLSSESLIAFKRFWHALNGLGMPDWKDFWSHRVALEANAIFWANKLKAIGDLTGNLVEYVKSQLK